MRSGQLRAWTCAGAKPDAHTERALVEALSSHPALAADVVAEARQIRQSAAAVESAAAEQAPAGQQEPGARDGAAGVAASGNLGSSEGAQAQGGAEASEGQGSGLLAAAPVRQGELQVDVFQGSSHSPLAGGAGVPAAGPAGGTAAEVLGQGGVLSSDGRLELRQLLWLDLHGMSQARLPHGLRSLCAETVPF